jgi:hypothetical protein
MRFFEGEIDVQDHHLADDESKVIDFGRRKTYIRQT